MTRAMTAEAMMAYMAATEPMASIGINVGGQRLQNDALFYPSSLEGETVHLDGRRYEVDLGGPLLIRAQDQAGLVNLAYMAVPAGERLGAMLGLPQRTSGRLISLYRDYVDKDALRQPNGAEVRDYGGTGPANRAMRRTDEWLSLLDIRRLAQPGPWGRIREHLAMDHTSTNENVNTATPEAMHILYGATPAQAEAAVQARAQQPFTAFADFAAVTGLPDTSGEGFYTYPSGRILLTIADRQSSWVYRSRLTLTPSGLERPVWIDQTELKEAPGRAVADLSDAVRLPYAPR